MTDTALTDGLRAGLTNMRQREDEAFRARVPRSLALGATAEARMPNGVPMAWMAGLFRTPPVSVSHGEGARFTDVDGNTYLDYNISDMSAVLGYAHPGLTEVIAVPDWVTARLSSGWVALDRGRVEGCGRCLGARPAGEERERLL